MTILNFQNPPILEAVFDISFTHSKNTINDLKSSNELFIKDFPNTKELSKIEGTINFSPESRTSSNHTKTLIGFSLSEEKEQSLIQRRINGFSFHKLKDYCGGDNFIKDAIKYWNINSQTLGNDLLFNRVGLRFINLIKIDKNPIDESFSISISKANQIGTLTKIAYNYSLDLENNYNATINLYPTSSNEYILDIDIFKTLDSKILQKNKIEEYFNFMRIKKNLIFSKTLQQSIHKKYKPIESKK